MKRQILFFLVLFASDVAFSNWADVPSRAMSPRDQTIANIWATVRKKYVERLSDSRQYPQVLYDFQIQSNLVFDFAVSNANLSHTSGEIVGLRIVDDIVTLANQAASKLVRRNSFWYPQSAGWVELPLAKPSVFWVDSHDHEVQLSSTQFLNYLTQILVRLLELREDQLTPSMKHFIRNYPSIILSHFDRWESDANGIWQVRGWGCRQNGEYVTGRFNFRDLLGRLLDKRLGNNLSYCNALTDFQLWVIAGVANVLRANAISPTRVPLTIGQQIRFRWLVARGTELIRTRFSNTDLQDFHGNAVKGTIIDPGSFVQHETYAYSGYEGTDFPIASDRKSGINISWDVSHARRLVQVMKALIDARPITGQTYPNALALRLLANQQAYGVFYEENGIPLFRNFWDGSNGWYRVNYSNRAGFGFPPGGLSSRWIDSGYCSWKKHNVDLAEICRKLESIVFDPHHPARPRYQQGMFSKGVPVNDSSLFNLQTSVVVMNFLAAMGTK